MLLPTQVMLRGIVLLYSIKSSACINPIIDALPLPGLSAFWDFQHFPRTESAPRIQVPP